MRSRQAFIDETGVIAKALSDKNGEEGNEKLLQACDLKLSSSFAKIHLWISLHHEHKEA